MFRIKFPSLASPCVELVCIHATYQYNTQHAGCEALSAVSLYTDAYLVCLRLRSRPERTHVIPYDTLLDIHRMISIRYYMSIQIYLIHVNTNIPHCSIYVLHVVSYWYHAIYRISHDICVEISRTYSRYWYRYIPKISHDISRILDTIPNTTRSKQFRTHTWGYANLPPSWLYPAYTAVVPTVLGFLNPQHPEPAEST